MTMMGTKALLSASPFRGHHQKRVGTLTTLRHIVPDWLMPSGMTGSGKQARINNVRSLIIPLPKPRYSPYVLLMARTPTSRPRKPNAHPTTEKIQAWENIKKLRAEADALDDPKPNAQTVTGVEFAGDPFVYDFDYNVLDARGSQAPPAWQPHRPNLPEKFEGGKRLK